MNAATEATASNEESLVTGQPGRGSEVFHGSGNQQVTTQFIDRPSQSSSDTGCEPREVSMACILIDADLQARESIDECTLTEYESIARQAAENDQSWPFPPVRLVNGWLVDGFHRYLVAKRLGRKSILAIRTQGDRDEALRIAISANAEHGLRRRRQDVQRAIRLATHSWPCLSAREIAKRVQCSPQTVLNHRERDERERRAEIGLPSNLDTRSDNEAFSRGEESFVHVESSESSDDDSVDCPQWDEPAWDSESLEETVSAPIAVTSPRASVGSSNPSAAATSSSESCGMKRPNIEAHSLDELIARCERACGAFARECDRLKRHPAAEQFGYKLDEVSRRSGILLSDIRKQTAEDRSEATSAA